MYIGIDIGGTKCAVVLADDNCNILEKVAFKTLEQGGADEVIARLSDEAERLRAGKPIKAVGISCGGPLDARAGLILSPPNLPGWDAVPICALLRQRIGAPVFLQNDADACALAEWKYGAGRGFDNLVFLTFGTGIGAGLILGGRLYAGGCGMAGEIGHVRLKSGGHIGHGKAGSLEGYCSGGGIAQYGYGSALEVAEKAKNGDAAAIEVYRQVGADLGAGIAMLLDILNPDAIIIGSIYTREQALLEESMQEVIRREALESNRTHCRILKAELGEALGDIAAVCVALNGF